MLQDYMLELELVSFVKYSGALSTMLCCGGGFSES